MSDQDNLTTRNMKKQDDTPHLPKRTIERRWTDPSLAFACTDFSQVQKKRTERWSFTKGQKVQDKRRQNQRFATLRRSTSSSTLVEESFGRISVGYAGPEPLGPDGLPLKSCLLGTSDSTIASRRNQAPPKRNALKRSVSFNNVQIRQYERALGDNPCVSSGLPLSIGWGYSSCPELSLEEYEMGRGPPREKGDLKIPPQTRQKMLLDQTDVSLKTLKATEESIKKERMKIIKSKRRSSAPTGQYQQQLEELSETAKRRLKRFVLQRSKVKEEEELWVNAHDMALEKLKNNEPENGFSQSLLFSSRDSDVHPPISIFVEEG